MKRRRLLVIQNRSSSHCRTQTKGLNDGDADYVVDDAVDDNIEIIPVNDTYHNDCYDDILYGNHLSRSNHDIDSYQQQHDLDDRDCIEDWTDVEATTTMTTIDNNSHTMEQRHGPQRQSVRSSWFIHLQWISSCCISINDNINQNSGKHLMLDPSQPSIPPMNGDGDMWTADEPFESNSHHLDERRANEIDDDNVVDDDDHTTNKSSSSSNDDTHDSRMLQLMIQHLSQQLVQVKRRLQPATERYNHYHGNVVTVASTRTTAKDIFHVARRNCNPYEVLGEGQQHGLNQYLFMNRSAIKLVNIDAILDFTLTTTTTNEFKFCDLCGAPGGFSEYLLWRFHQNYYNQNYCHQDGWNTKDGNHLSSPKQLTSCRGYGMSLMGNNEHGYGLPWKLQETNRYTNNDNNNDNHYYYVNNNNNGNHSNGEFRSSYKICYGVDGTGDIYNWENVAALQDTIYKDDIANAQIECEDGSHNHEYGKVHLVVVDGGLDVQRNTEYQEEVSLKLVVSETAAALSILCTGGTFVIKLFGFQTSIVRTMMLHLYMMFDRIIAMKPISSRPASAERYVVCQGYHGHPSHWSGQRWCNDLYLSRPCTIMNYATSDINYIEKETQLLRYLDEFDRDMYLLNLKASFAILSYIERKYLQRVILNDTENSDGMGDTDDDIEENPCDFDDDNDVDDGQLRINISMYRLAWRLEN